MFEPGVMFWAERDNLEMVRSLGVRYGQLGIPGGMQLTDAAAAQWKTAIEGLGLTLVTVFAAYEGEDYADIPAVARSVGFVPPDTRAARLARTLAVSDFAAQLGVASIACHVGFVRRMPRIRITSPCARWCGRSATMRHGTGRPSRWKPARNRLTCCWNSFATWTAPICGSTSIRPT